MKRRCLLLAVLGCTLLPSLAHSQNAYLGPQLGIYNVPNADAARLTGGLALRLRLNEALGIEGSVNYRQEDYAGGRVTVKSWPVMLSGLLYPLPMLYGVVGAGWYNSAVEYHLSRFGLADIDGQTEQKFGWHFGAGAELPVGRHAKLTGDIRYVFLNYDFKQFPGSPGAQSNFYVVSVGLLFGL